MTSTIQVFTASQEMLHLREQLNEFVYSQFDNPYLLFSFVEQFFQSNAKKGKKPLFMVYFVGQRIVGFASFIVHRWKGLFRVANFLLPPEYDLDFIVQENYRKNFLYKTVDFLLNKMECNFIDISLSPASKSVRALEDASKSIRAYHIGHPITGHSVLNVEGTWAEFEKERGRNFRKFFRRIERRMGKAGTWKVMLATRESSEPKIFNDILEIEKSSWKQEYRTQRGLELDQKLLDLWAGAIHSSHEAGFRWQVAFLEIDGRRIAYSFWLEYKHRGIICKTSFDNNYRKFYPGIYINNIAVRELFNNPAIKQIDFMTDLPFQKRWAPTLIPRLSVTISKSPISIVLSKTLNNQNLSVIRAISRFASLV